MATQAKIITAQDLERISASRRCELVRGELREMAPAGARHGKIALQIGRLLGNYAQERKAGEALAAETGFVLERRPDTVRAPDAAFISNERLPSGGLPAGYLEMAPDLAVEVVSPGDSAADVQERIEDWLRAGTRLVWVVYPKTRAVAVYQPGGEARILSSGDVLDGGAVLPGFSAPVSAIV